MSLALPKSGRSKMVTGILLVTGSLLLFSLTFRLVLQIFGLSQFNAVSFFISRILFWTCLFIAVFYSKKIEHQKLLLWQEKKYNVLTYLLMAGAIFLSSIIGAGVLLKLLSYVTSIKPNPKMKSLTLLLQHNIPLLFFTCVTAGVVEELLCRGYLQPRLEILFKSRMAGVLLSAMIFGLLHYGYGSIAKIVATFFIGFIFALYYSNFRNIKLLIVFHFLWDLSGLLLSFSYPLR